jgi:SAM-dependent methyltransferase
MGTKARGGRIRRLAGAFRHWPIHPQWLLGGREEREALREACRSLSGKIVDIGCADKRASRFLPPGCDYIGIDYPGTATGLYGTRPDAFADARNLPFRDASVDGIVLKDVLEHIDGPRTALRECARILRPGGTMVLWMPFMYPVHDAPHDYQRFTEHGLSACLGDAGFDVAASSRVLKPIVTAGLLASLALADSCERIMARQRWLLPLVPALVVLIALVNLLAFAFGALPGSGFMPAFNRVVAVRRG